MKKIFLIVILIQFSFLNKTLSQCKVPLTPEGQSKSSCSSSGTLSVQSYIPVGEVVGDFYHKWYTSSTGSTTAFITTPTRPYSTSSNLVSTVNVSGPKTYWVSAVCGSLESSRIQISYSVQTASNLYISRPGYSDKGLCRNDSEFTLYAGGGTGYSWMVNGGPLIYASSIKPTVEGRYVLFGTPTCGSSSQYVIFDFKYRNNAGVPTFTKGQTSVCRGSAGEYIVSSTDADRYEWSITPSHAGTISAYYNWNVAQVKWADNYVGNATIYVTAVGCTRVTTSLPVYLQPPTILELPAAKSRILCGGGASTISATTTNANIKYHEWYNSSNQLLGTKEVIAHTDGTFVTTWPVNETNVGTYTYYVSSSSNSVTCPLTSSERTAVTYTVKAPTDIKIIPLGVNMTSGSVPPVCEGDPDFRLKANGGGNYIWKNSRNEIISRADSISPTESGTYSLTGTNNCGNTFTKYQTITINSKTPGTPVFALKENEFCQGHSTSSYSVTSNNSYSYSWWLSDSTAGKVNSNTSTAIVSWSPSFSGKVQVWAAAYGCDGTVGRSSYVTVNIKPILAIIKPTVNNVTGCAGGRYSISAQSYNDTTVVKHTWYTSATGYETVTPTRNGKPHPGIKFCTSALDTIFTESVTYWVEADRTGSGFCGATTSERVPVSFTLVSTPSEPILDTRSVLKVPANSPTILKLMGGENYTWYNSGGGVAHRGNNFYTSNLLNTTTYTVSAYAPGAPGCESTRKSVTVTVFHQPKVNAGNDIKLFLPTGTTTTSVVLNGSATDADGSIQRYAWTKLGGPAVLSGTSTTTLNVTGLVKGNYIFRLTATDNEGYTGIDEVQVTVISSEENYNYIRETVVLEAGKTLDSQLPPLSVFQKNVTTTYFDGLGREMQKVNWQASPVNFQNSSLRRDLVQPRTYDRFGRDSISYLPYSIGSNGLYKQQFKTEQSNFYKASDDKIVNDNFPFAIPVFEASPLNRIKEQGAPGATWQPGGRTIGISYGVNISNEVKLWVVNDNGLPQSTSTYPQGYLTLTTTKDEKGAQTKEYKDKEGKVVLMRRQAADTIWMDTYYLYDIYGNLRYVFPPECSAKWPTDQSLVKEHLDLWAFRYKYDEKKRMIEKKVPGSGRVLMIYDALDRVVLSQDSVQSKKKQWLYTKYDELGRAIITGLHTDTSPIDSIKSKIEKQTKLFEEAFSSGHGYTQSNCYPFGPSNNEVLTVSYYDDYRFLNQSWFEESSGRKYSYSSGKAGYPSSFNPRVKGQVTAQKIKVLGENRWLNTVSYFDEKYRIVRTISENALDGADTVSMVYDFTGKILSARQEHTGVQATITTKIYEYDHAGRLIKLWHQIGDQATKRVLLAENKYNELGQLIDKGIGVNVNTGVAVQSIDYRYNIRGWLKSINNSSLTDDQSSNDDSSDLFGMELLYEQSTY